MQTGWKIKMLVLANVLLITLFVVSGFGGSNSFKNLEVGSLIIKSPDSKSSIHLGFSDNQAMISIVDEAGRASFQVVTAEDGSVLSLNDAAGSERVAVKGGSVPGIFMKNDENKTIGTWTMLSDGGSGFGLANRNGGASTILRGGLNPSVSFFNANSEPTAALGMIQKVPHLLISGPVGNEGILIHGGKPSSMLFVDEIGKVNIMISKHGVFQGKKEGAPAQPKKEKKVFSFDDTDMFFPDVEMDEKSHR